MKRSRRKNKIKQRITTAMTSIAVVVGVLLLTLMCIQLIVPRLGHAEDNMTDSKAQSAVEAGTNDVQEKQINITISDINSPDALLMKAGSGEVISENHGNERIYPASMTKIMTAILAIEKVPDLQKKIEIRSEMFDSLYVQNASRAGFEPGESATAEDLIYGVLLPSGAECCLTLANEITGSEESFVDLMNEKAQKIGMENTHFCNSTGLHDENHYSTAADMATLLRYALKSEMFRSVFTSSRHTTAASNIHPEGFTFNSTLFKYLDDTTVTGGQLLGGKTGYTQEAGQCLASLATIDGEEYILVTAGAPGDTMTEQLHIDDAIKIFDRLGEELGH